MAIIVQWPDGTLTFGKTARELLRVLADMQWEDIDPKMIPELLSDRVWNLVRAAIDPELPTREFFTQLEAAGICTVVTWTPEEES